MKVYSTRTIVKVFQEQGFYVDRWNHHVHMRHPDGRYVTIPVHDAKDLSPGLCRKIFTQAKVPYKR